MKVPVRSQDDKSAMKRTTVVHESKKLSRVLEVTLQDKKLQTPTYFPAISSYGIKFSVLEQFYFLEQYNYHRVLVSAYDLNDLSESERKKMFSWMKRYRKKGVLFLDSGLFESSWKVDTKWNIGSYKNLMSQAKFDIYTCFDVLPAETGKEDKTKFKEKTFGNIVESSMFMNNAVFFPILHGSSPGELIGLVKDFVDQFPQLCNFVALPERDCGKSVLERAETILEIRKLLNNNDCRNLLHILGCGNPLSMLLFSYCGADSFDSLDWVKSVFNPTTLSMNDFSHLELLDCACPVCTEALYKDAEYSEKALLHNLLFYKNFATQLQSMILNDNLFSYLKIHLGSKIVDQVDEF